jgi:predicted ATPase
MLTRLKVSGFKNLVDMDVRFGPFTCIAGANAVGKSNLFDAISFLGALANQPLIEAAKLVREGRTADVRGLFHRVGQRHDETMSFMAEMIIPEKGTDDLGQEVKAAITFVCYTLELAFRKVESQFSFGGFEILKEELEQINVRKAKNHLLFPHRKEWRTSIISGRRTVPFISTKRDEAGRAQIKLHQDRGESRGRPALFLASTLPRTVLSSANAPENRTAVLVRREMQSWRRLQLEPSALRKPDEFMATPRLESDGAHLAATLHHLAGGQTGSDEAADERAGVYARIANRLANLIDDVRDVKIDVDRQRELFTLVATDRAGTEHPARALSDGTLRFLALAVIELDPFAQGVLCLEEPENGINPLRIPAMLQLLRDIATDPDEPVGPDNPLRQVIINTHSPVVVSEVPGDALVVAESRETVRETHRFQRASFGCLPGTWRDVNDPEGKKPDVVALGTLFGYLSPVPMSEAEPEHNGHPEDSSSKRPRPRRVIDRPDVRQLLLFGNDPE